MGMAEGDYKRNLETEVADRDPRNQSIESG